MSQTKNNKQQQINPNDEVAKKAFLQEHLPNAIMLSVELESAFKMYSYRVLTPEQFIARTKELVKQFSR